MDRRPFPLSTATAAAIFALGLFGACSRNEAATTAAARPDSAPSAAARQASAPAAAAGPASAPATAATPAGVDLYALASRGTGFTVGVPMAANTVYVFFDSTCPHCAQLWSSSKPLLGKLKITWMPIGLLRQSSAPQGATILSSPDPAAAMAENEMLVLNRQNGIAIDPKLSDEVLAKVKANTDLFMQTGAQSVPLIVFRNARTGQSGSHAGAVDSAQLAALVGL